MPVGSHKDAFKAHQLVKKLVDKDRPTPLASLAAEVLLDFVKNQRQIAADGTLSTLPPDPAAYDAEKIAAALNAVGSLCGQCEEAHDDACFVNQARRVLIAAKTGVDIGSFFDGKKTFQEMLAEAEAKAEVLRVERAAAEAAAAPAVEVAVPATGGTSAPAAESRPAQQLLEDLAAGAPGVGGKPALNAAEREELEQLREKDVFRATLIDEVVQTITSVTEGNYAAEMPVHEDEQLGKLATAFNLMLRAIHTTMSGLDKLVQERSSELKQIMDTVPLGLLTVNGELRVNPEYSRAAETILGEKELRGRDFLDLLGLTRRREADRQKLIDYLELFQLRLLSDDDLLPLNPFPELELAPDPKSGNPRWVRMIYHALKPKDGVEKSEVLVEIADISEAKRLASEVAASQQENMQIRAIAADPELFRDFLAEVRKILRECQDGLSDLRPDAPWKDRIHALFRGVHTIKGSSGSFGLGGVARDAGALEDDLGKARDLEELPAGFAESLREPFAALCQAVAEVEEIARPILGDEVDSDVPHIRVRLDALKEIEAELRRGIPAELARAALTQKVRDLQDIPAKKALSRSLKLIPGLIKRLGKEAGFSFGGSEVLIPFESGVALNGPLTHMLRNAFDHGLEDEETRRHANKPPKGMVTLTVLRFDHEYTVTLSDDGKGLNPIKLRESAVKKGVITPEEAAKLKDKEAQMLIFRPGFSTAASVTDVSGRGVGMDAVLSTVRDELGGYIDIDSVPGKGSIFALHIPLPQ